MRQKRLFFASGRGSRRKSMVSIEIVEDARKAFKEATPRRMRKDSRERVILMTPEIFSKVFSPERVRLLKHVQRHGAESVSGLARELKRTFEAVSRDLSYLSGIGLVDRKSTRLNSSHMS